MNDMAASTNHDRIYDEHMENYDFESSAIYRKLQSKIEALNIMRNELEKNRTERDQFKLMAETLQLRYSAIKNSINSSDFHNMEYNNGSSAGFLINESRERNLSLTTEVEALRQKLSELQGDIKLLRNKNSELINEQKERIYKDSERNSSETNLSAWDQEKSKFICQMEVLKKKNAQLQYDFRSLLDEKEEIVMERDAYKCKSHRLNHELNVVLKGENSQSKILDIDGLILENKYQQERLTNLENELELARQSVSKYKTMLDTKRKKGIIKLGTNNTTDMIMSHTQVKNLLERGTISELPLKAATISDLKSLCLALLDNLNDKNLALSHQRKTNKLLATKIADLEQRIKVISGSDVSTSILSPSQILLNGYTSATVDQDCNDIIIKKVVIEGGESSDESKKVGQFSSESNKSVVSSSEIDCDTASEYTLGNYDNIKANAEILQELPPEIAKLVLQMSQQGTEEPNED